VAGELADNAQIRLIVTGGTARPGELSLVGDLAERTFEELLADVVFLGVGGVAGVGLTEFNLDDTRVKRAVRPAKRCSAPSTIESPAIVTLYGPSQPAAGDTTTSPTAEAANSATPTIFDVETGRRPR